MKTLTCIRNLFAMSLLFLTSLTNAQEIEWQRTIGGNGNDILYSVSQTLDGGFICGGTSWSFISGDKIEHNHGFGDYWVIKLNSSGIIQWQNTIGGSDEDQLRNILQTTDGGYICGGYSRSLISFDKTEHSLGYYDFWIVKLDSSGNIQWQNTIGGSHYDKMYSISETNDKGFICGGSSQSGISGDKTENSMGNDYWVVKLDSTGNILWQNTIGGSHHDILYSISQTYDGGYICGGESKSGISGDKTENCSGDEDYWIIKLDSSGNIEWQNTIGGNNYDRLYSIKQTNDGGYICGGASESNVSGDKSQNCMGKYDYWVLKLDSIGNIQWQKTIGGSEDDMLTTISESEEGGFICGGYSNSDISGNKTVGCLGCPAGWIVKLDPSGNIQFQNTIGGILNSLSLCSDNGYIIGGYSASDYFIAKLRGNYNFITGKVYFDGNSNGLMDAGEPVLANNKITEQITGRYSYSQQNGVYYITVFDTGSFITEPGTINFYNSIPGTQSILFSGIHQTDSLNDFAFQPSGVFNDLCVSITPLGPFRSGFNASYKINYGNYGTTTLNGTVIFYPDSNITFLSSNVVPASVSADSIVWNTGLLSPFQMGSIVVTVHVNVGLPIGTLIYPTVHIDPMVGDAVPQCNDAAYEVYITGSFDPNDIIVNPDTLTTQQVSGSPYLEYIIRFQNTGNDTAFTVKILNPVDTNKLKIKTLELIASSHPVNLNYIRWENNMEFKFDNILLPDSNVDEPMSHGFVRYKIKVKPTVQAGNTIKNYAFIYFDFNLPVITNKAKTWIVSPTTVEQGADGDFRLVVFPNPAKDWLFLKRSGLHWNGEGELKVMDSFGRMLYSYPIQNLSADFGIDISGLATGFYFVQLETGNQLLRAKFVKQ